MSRCLHVVLSVVLGAALAAAQNVSSSVNGTLVDPTGAVIEGAACILTRQGTGAVLTAISGSEGLFTFPNVAAGSYALSIQHPGFKAFELKGVSVSSSEIRSLGRLTLQIGEVRESVSVTAENTPLQLSSAERSGRRHRQPDQRSRPEGSRLLRSPADHPRRGRYCSGDARGDQQPAPARHLHQRHA